MVRLTNWHGITETAGTVERKLRKNAIFKIIPILLSLTCAIINVISPIKAVKTNIELKENEAKSTGEIFTHGEAGQRRVALTFDDGPHKEFTPEILDILKRENICATFFVVGQNAENMPDMIDRLMDEGHEIGNHTYEHTFLKGLDKERQTREIDLCDDELFYHSEYCTHLLRPPGGLYDDNVIDICAERGYSIVIWSIDTRDWTGASTQKIIDTVMDNLEDGSIILLHDFNRPGSHTVEAVSQLIPEIKKLGYSFVTVSELIGE